MAAAVGGLVVAAAVAQHQAQKPFCAFQEELSVWQILMQKADVPQDCKLLNCGICGGQEGDTLGILSRACSANDITNDVATSPAEPAANSDM